MAGGHHRPEIEGEVARMLSEGMEKKDIADAVGMSRSSLSHWLAVREMADSRDSAEGDHDEYRYLLAMLIDRHGRRVAEKIIGIDKRSRHARKNALLRWLDGSIMPREVARRLVAWASSVGEIDDGRAASRVDFTRDDRRRRGSGKEAT